MATVLQVKSQQQPALSSPTLAFLEKRKLEARAVEMV